MEVNKGGSEIGGGTRRKFGAKYNGKERILSLPRIPVHAVDTEPGENAAKVLIRKHARCARVAHRAAVVAVSQGPLQAAGAEDSAAALDLGGLPQDQQAYRTLRVDTFGRRLHERTLVPPTSSHGFNYAHASKQSFQGVRITKYGST